MDVGELFVISAPSGTGKTTLVQALTQQVERLQLSISHTTRERRVGERSGEHYHFVEREHFLQMVAQGEFLEYAEVFGHHYGTTRSEVVSRQQQAQDVILEIDWQGAHQIRKQLPCISIFILPPSFEALRLRLNRRGDPSCAATEARLQQARTDVLQYRYFDFLVFNDDFDRALADLSAIIRSRRLRLARQSEANDTALEQLLAASSAAK